MNFWCRESQGKLNHVPTSNKRIVLALLIYLISKLNSLMKEIVPKRDLWSRSGTKSAAVGCKQAANDDERCQSYGLVFSNICKKLFGDIDAITYLKPPHFTNRQILTPICGYGKETFLHNWHISIGRCTCILSYMLQHRKCSHVVTAAFPDHNNVHKTDLKPLRLVKSEWSPLLK